MDDDELGNWRAWVVTTLAKDLPSSYPGGPSHKAGTPVHLSTLTIDSSDQLVGFITPSPVALTLSIAEQATKRGSKLRSEVTFGDIMTPLGHGKGVTNNTCSALYDYFECCMIAIVFIFQALEAYANEVIANKVSGNFKLKRRDEVLEVSSEELQRVASTEEKLSKILPEILETKSPKGRRVWHQFKELKRIRDTATHLKSFDAYRRFELDRETLFHQFFHGKIDKYPRYAIEMIDFYQVREEEPRWFFLAKQRILSR